MHVCGVGSPFNSTGIPSQHSMTICDPRLPTAQFRIYLVRTGTALSIDMRGGKPRTRGPEASDTRVLHEAVLYRLRRTALRCVGTIGQRDCGLGSKPCVKSRGPDQSPARCTLTPLWHAGPLWVVLPGLLGDVPQAHNPQLGPTAVLNVPDHFHVAHPRCGRFGRR